MGFLEDLVVASVLLFVVLDPIGVSPYFASIVARRGGGAEIVAVAVASAGVILVGFALIGMALLGLLGVSQGEFMVAAGLLLLIYAAADLFEVKIGYPGEESGGGDVAVFPLATPLLAGPGSIATVMYIVDQYGASVALASIALNLAVAYPILAASTRLVALLGRHGSLLVGKFMAFIMAGFAVSIIFEGLRRSGVIVTP